MSSKLQEDGTLVEAEEKKPKKKSSKTKNLLAEGMADIMKKKKKSTKTKKSHREAEAPEQEADDNNAVPTGDAGKKKKKKSKKDKEPQPEPEIVQLEQEEIIEEQQEEQEELEEQEPHYIIEEAPPNEEYDEHDSQFKGHNQSQQLEQTESQANEPEIVHESAEKVQEPEETNEELLPPKPPKKKVKKSHKKSRKSEPIEADIKQPEPELTSEKVEAMTSEKANLVFKNVKSGVYANTIAKVLESLSNLKGNLNVYVYVSDDQKADAPSLNIANKINELLQNIDNVAEEVVEEVVVDDQDDAVCVEDDVQMVENYGLENGYVDGYAYYNHSEDVHSKPMVYEYNPEDMDER